MKDEALRLASVPIFERSISWQADATAEFKRLHSLNAELVEALEGAARIFDGGPIRVSREYVSDLALIRTALKKATEAA